MEMEDVEKDLQRRINQSREWLESGGADLISGLKIRDYPCQAEPTEFLDDPQREERHGIRFRLEYVTDRATFESFVDVRIKATRSLSKDGQTVANAPYIVIYVLNNEKQKSEIINYEYLENTIVYKNSLSLDIKEYYKDYLFKALRHKNVFKIFKFRKEI